MVTQEVINLKDGNKICVINDYIGKLIKNSKGYYEEELLVNFIDYIPFNAVIYDIGANIGNHTVFFSKYVKPKKIISFEPSKELFEILKKNIQINDINNAQLINSAVGEKEDKGVLNFNAVNSGASDVNVTENGDIQIVKIDDLELESPDFIKIDVEGFEYLALKGMDKVLLEKGPLLWVEIQPENLYQVDSFLNERGYSLIDRWLDNYIYLKPNKKTDLVQIINQIKNKPFQRFNSKIMEINLKYRTITEQNNTLQNKIKMLEGEYLEEQKKTTKLNNEINELKITIPHLKEQLDFVKSMDTTVRDQLVQGIDKKYKNDLKNHETKVSELNAERTFLLNNITELKQKLEKSEEYTLSYFNEHANLEILKSKYELIQRENNILLDSVRKIDIYKSDIKELEKEVNKKAARLLEITHQNELLKLNLGKLENEFREKLALEKSLNQEQSETIKILKEQITELEKVVNEQTANIQEITHHNEILKVDSEKMKNDFLEKLIRENELVREQLVKIEALEGKIMGLENSLLEKESEIDNLNSENYSQNLKLNNLQQELKEKEENLIVVLADHKEKEQIISDLKNSNVELIQQDLISQKKISTMKNNNIDIQNQLNKNHETINMIRLENEKLIAENVDLKSELENEIIEKIKLINNEELFALKIENELVLIKKSEDEKAALNNKISKLEKQLAKITQKYNSLSNSKLGKITTKYWVMRKQWIRGK